MNRSLAYLPALLVMSSVCAQTPVPLLDSPAPVSPKFQAAASKLQAALECRQKLDPADPALRALLPENDSDQWALTPPRGFSVFGLPVQAIRIYIDSSGELGASYTAIVAADKGTTEQKIRDPRKRIGDVTIQAGTKLTLTDVTCTVGGEGND